jgi:hypothetical protein
MKEAICNLTRRVLPISSHDMIACVGTVAVEVGTVAVELIGPWV